MLATRSSVGMTAVAIACSLCGEAAASDSRGAYAAIDDSNPSQLEYALKFGERLARAPGTRKLQFEVLVCGEGVKVLDRGASIAGRVEQFVAAHPAYAVVVCSETMDRVRAAGHPLKLIDGIREDSAAKRLAAFEERKWFKVDVSRK